METTTDPTTLDLLQAAHANLRDAADKNRDGNTDSAIDVAIHTLSLAISLARQAR